MFSVPASFALGVLGIIFDTKKALAITTTVIVGLLVCWYAFMIIASFVLHR
jgi:hypothetical protein